MFWEAEVPCSMVGPWLHPILNEVPEAKEIVGVPGFYYEILAVVCCLRRPRISALCLGVVVSGPTPTILHRVKGTDHRLMPMLSRGLTAHSPSWILLA